LVALVLIGLGGAVAYYKKLLPFQSAAGSETSLTKKAAAAPSARELRPSVSVAAALPSQFVDSILVTGTLVPRHEILVAAEVEGLRVVELTAEEGDTVIKGQLLARLEQETLDAQLAHNQATLERATAAIAQARSQIAQAEARLEEAKASFERAEPLRQSGAVSEAVYDQRLAASRTTEAQLVAARNGLKLAEAELAQVQAQRRELTWKRSKTEIRAPADGIVSRRTSRIGGMPAAAGEPMFRIIGAGEIELEAEVPEFSVPRLKEGQLARIAVAGVGDVVGHIRLVSPEIDRVSRLGKVRIALGASRALRIGAFGRGRIDIAQSKGLAVPASAVMHTSEGARVLVVKNDVVETRAVSIGLAMSDQIEIVGGLSEGELVVAKSGTFLRQGDRVRPHRPGAHTVSEVN